MGSGLGLNFRFSEIFNPVLVAGSSLYIFIFAISEEDNRGRWIYITSGIGLLRRSSYSEWPVPHCQCVYCFNFSEWKLDNKERVLYLTNVPKAIENFYFKKMM